MKTQTLWLALPVVLFLASLSVLAANWTAGSAGISWELSPPTTAAKGESFQCTASASYNPNMPAGTEWECGSPSISFEWQANPDGSVSNQSDTPTGGSNGSFSYKSNVTIKYDNASAQVNDKSVKVRAHVTGTILDYGPDEEKGTADDVTYTIGQWSDWLTASLTSVDLSVSASRSFLLAGAGGGSARQATITATVTPSACTGNVSFSIESGTGEGRYSAASLSSSSASLTNGQAQVTLTSSDAVEMITVTASYGEAAKSVSVWTDYPSCEWAFDPDYIDSETTSEVTVTLTFEENATPDRSVSFQVVEVLLSNGQYTTENLSNYATFDDPGPKATDSNGTATATLRAGPDVEQCTVIYIALNHENVWIEE